MCLHCLTFQPSTATHCKAFTAAPATGRWDRGTETEGVSGLIHPMMGPTQLPSQDRARPSEVLLLGLGNWSGWLFTHYLQPHWQEGRWNRGKDGGGDWMPSLTTVLPQTPLHDTSVVWREQEMGKAVRAASSGISGRAGSVIGEGACGCRDWEGAFYPHKSPVSPTSLAPATRARLGAEAGEGVQARLTAHG